MVEPINNSKTLAFETKAKRTTSLPMIVLLIFTFLFLGSSMYLYWQNRQLQLAASNSLTNDNLVQKNGYPNIVYRPLPATLRMTDIPLDGVKTYSDTALGITFQYFEQYQVFALPGSDKEQSLRLFFLRYPDEKEESRIQYIIECYLNNQKDPEGAGVCTESLVSDLDIFIRRSTNATAADTRNGCLTKTESDRTLYSCLGQGLGGYPIFEYDLLLPFDNLVVSMDTNSPPLVLETIELIAATLQPIETISTPATNIQFEGIWQMSSSMAAGWNDRYHFFPTGTFHFYPNQMTPLPVKTEKVGSWKYENGSLTLVTTKTIDNSYTCNEAVCTLTETTVNNVSNPLPILLQVKNVGVQGDDFYPSIILDGKQYWKFSDDATSYGSETFPE